MTTPKQAAWAIDLWWAIKRTADNQDASLTPLLAALRTLIQNLDGENNSELLAELDNLVDAATQGAFGSVADNAGKAAFRVMVYNAIGIEPEPNIEKATLGG